MICTEYCFNQQITVLINLHSSHGISKWHANEVSSYYIYINDIKNQMKQDKQKFKMNKKTTKWNTLINFWNLQMILAMKIVTN